MAVFSSLNTVKLTMDVILQCSKIMRKIIRTIGTKASYLFSGISDILHGGFLISETCSTRVTTATFGTLNFHKISTSDESLVR